MLIRAEQLRPSTRSLNAALDAACADLGIANPGAVKQRRYRYRR